MTERSLDLLQNFFVHILHLMPICLLYLIHWDKEEPESFKETPLNIKAMKLALFEHHQKLIFQEVQRHQMFLLYLLLLSLLFHRLASLNSMDSQS